MRIVGIFALTVGAAMLVGLLPLFIYENRLQREVQFEIAQFGTDIEALRDSLTHVANTADSVRAHERIAGLQEGVARLEPVVVRGQAALQGWWRPTGPGGTLLHCRRRPHDARMVHANAGRQCPLESPPARRTLSGPRIRRRHYHALGLKQQLYHPMP